MMRRLWRPTVVTGLALAGYLAWVLIQHGGDPLALVKLGDPQACTGYDGQFTYALAQDLAPRSVAARLDVPAYRYQRILLPLLARLLALGQPAVVAWTIPLVNVAAHLAAVAILEGLLQQLQVSPWLALVYGLWPGLVVAVRTDLSEPLAYGLVILAYGLDSRRRPAWAAAALGLALLAKETTLLFALAQFLEALTRRDRRQGGWLILLTFFPFALWQSWLWAWFGRPGLGSGGCLATPFEWMPFMGLWRIAAVHLPTFLIFLLFLGPGVVAPSVWGLWASGRELWQRRPHPYTWALLVNAALIPWTPFSTFREPVAMLRFCTGLVLATLLFAGVVRWRRALVYPWFWLALLVFLVKD